MTSATKEFTKLRKIFISNGLVEKKIIERKRLTNKSSKNAKRLFTKLISHGKRNESSLIQKKL